MRKNVAGFAKKKKKEIENVQDTKNPSSEIIPLTEIKKDDAAQKARMIFFFSQVGKKAADKYRWDRNKRAILTCTQRSWKPALTFL